MHTVNNQFNYRKCKWFSYFVMTTTTASTWFFLKYVKIPICVWRQSNPTESCFSFCWEPPGHLWTWAREPLLHAFVPYFIRLIYVTSVLPVSYSCIRYSNKQHVTTGWRRLLAWVAQYSVVTLAGNLSPDGLTDRYWFWFRFAWQCVWQPHQSRQKLWQSGTAWMYERRWGWGQRAASGEQR